MSRSGERLSSMIEQLQQAERRSTEITGERRHAERAELDAEDDAAVDQRVASLIALEKEAAAVSTQIAELTYKIRLLGNAQLPALRANRQAQQAENAADVRGRELDYEAANKQLEAAREEVNAAADRVNLARAAIDAAALRGVALALNRKNKNIQVSSASPLHPPAGVLVKFGDWFDLITAARSTSAAWLDVVFDERQHAIELVDARSIEGSRISGLIAGWQARGQQH